jgi:hypothetical protein
METCNECGSLLKWVCDDTILRHPLHTVGRLKNRGMIWCGKCDTRQIIDPWSSDENNTCATILKMVEPPFVEWQASAKLAPSQVETEMARRILQNGDWQAPLGWKHLSCVSFLSPQTTEVDQLDNRRFFLNSLEQPNDKIVLKVFSGYHLTRCISPISNQEFDFVFFNMPNVSVSDESLVVDEWARRRFFEVERISDRSGKFTLTRDKTTGEIVDIDVEYPDPPEPNDYFFLGRHGKEKSKQN